MGVSSLALLQPPHLLGHVRAGAQARFIMTPKRLSTTWSNGHGVSRSTSCRARAPSAQSSPNPQQPGQEAQLPTTFKRLVARRTGKSFRDVAEVEEAALPTPGEGEALVRVKYAGVNGGCETFRSRGEYAFARNNELPWFALGAEGAGEVVALGPGVAGLAVGQHVTFVGGAFAEYVVAKAALCWPVPEATPESVALTISGTVAATALEAVAGLREGETLLVTAAAGATGHFAVQLGLLAGCHVVATCGGPQKAARLRELGVHRVIDYTAEDVRAVLSAEYPARVDVIYEGVGGALQRTVYASLAPGGRMLQVGYISEYPHNEGSGSGSGGAAGQDATSATTAQQQQHPAATAPEVAMAAATGGKPLPPCAELFWQGLMVEREGGRTVYGQVWPKDRADMLRCKAYVFDLHTSGKLQAWVDASEDFVGVASVADAVEHMLTGRCIGKVVVRL